MKKIEVVAAVIRSEGKTLCVQRGQGKYEYVSEKWEFPGGKVEANETQNQALLREIKEELLIDISVDSFLITVEHKYPDFELVMHCYLCSTDSKELTLTEHIDHKWLDDHQLSILDWAEADIPVVEKLIQ